MPVVVQNGQALPVTSDDVAALWAATIAHRSYADDTVTIRCVDTAESQRLNREYRHKDKSTNVLTFSYGDGTHDIALCMTVATDEARVREVALRDYVALLIVHAFLHATGMDHERSAEDGQATQQAERAILKQCGYATSSL